MLKPWVLQVALLAACCGWASTMAYYWRANRKLRRELDFLERLANYQHDSILRLSVQLFGRKPVDKAIHDAHERGRN